MSGPAPVASNFYIGAMPLNEACSDCRFDPKAYPWGDLMGSLRAANRWTLALEGLNGLVREIEFPDSPSTTSPGGATISGHADRVLDQLRVAADDLGVGLADALVVESSMRRDRVQLIVDTATVIQKAVIPS